MSPKEVALAALKIALAVFPPLADFIAKAIENASAEHRPLADEVAELLPEHGASEAAAKKLAGGG